MGVRVSEEEAIAIVNHYDLDNSGEMNYEVRPSVSPENARDDRTGQIYRSLHCAICTRENGNRL